MRKRKETQKGSLSSAQATRDNMSQKNNVAEQERMEGVMNKINDVLDGENMDDIIAAAISIIIGAIKQMSNGNIPLARSIFKATLLTHG